MTPKRPIFVVDKGGDLVQMHPAAPSDEASLQELIARHPEIIGDKDGELLLIKREQPISDADQSGGRWSLDHLFVTRTAIPVLVEVKRAVDTRLRREVVGQMLDYAANGVAYWATGTVAGIFAQRCEAALLDPESVLLEFIGADADPENFWSQVDANFRAGRVKLVFVADEIPRELARIVEFLNEQMTADVRAVELQYFEGAGGFRTLAPRIIGETERAQAQKSTSRAKPEPISQADWIQKFIEPRGPATVSGLRAALDILEELGAETAVASSQGSIAAMVRDATGKQVYPMHLQRNGTATLSFGWVHERLSESCRKSVLDDFNRAIGPLSTGNLKGYPAFPLGKLTDPGTADAFRTVTRAYLNSFRDGPPTI